jgi:hypothetical protein
VRIRDTATVERAKELLAPLTEAVSAGLLSGGILQEVTLEEPEPGLFRLNLTDQGIEYRMAQAVSQTVEVIARPHRRTRHDRTDDPASGRRTASSCRCRASTIRSA